MRKLLSSLAICATLALSSCQALDNTIDHAGDRTEKLVTHTTQEIRGLKDELKEDLSKLKTEALSEVRTTIEEMTPVVVERAVDKALNAEAVAFMIVSLTGLIGLVVVVAVLIILGFFRALWKRLAGNSKLPQASKESTPA